MKKDSLLEKSWPYLSLALLAILFASLLYFPDTARILGLIIVVFSAGMVVLFAVRKHWQAYKKGQLGQRGLWRNISIEVIGILVMLGLSLWLANLAAPVVSGLVREVVEPRWVGLGLSHNEGWGESLGLVAGLLAAILIGLGVGALVYAVSKRLMVKSTMFQRNDA